VIRGRHTLALSGNRNLFQGVDIDLNVDTADADAEEIKYRREYNLLYTDQATGYIRYLKQTTNITPWDPLMLTAIETRMASKLAIWLTGKITLAQMLHQEFIQTIGLAVQVRAMEGRYEDNLKLLAILDQNFIGLLNSEKVVRE